jgi:hypothetical protein
VDDTARIDRAAAFLADRPRVAGFAPTMITGGPGPWVVLTDPGGDGVQLHPAL